MEKTIQNKLLMIVAALAVLIVECIVFGGFGVAVPICIVAFLGVIFWYAKSLGINTSLKNQKLLIPIMFIAFSFVLFDNNLLKFFNSIFLYALIILQMVEVLNGTYYESFTKDWLLEILHTGVVLPLQHIEAPLKVVKLSVGEERKVKLKKFGNVVLGVAIAIPVVMIVTILLSSADAAFNGVMNSIINSIDIDINAGVQRLVVFVVLFVILYALLYGLYDKKNIMGPMRAKKSRKVLDFTIVITTESLISAVYILYVFSQLAYFISAFKGVLPEDYTFAQYARQGFFELVPVIFINLFLLSIMQFYTRIGEEVRKERWIKRISLFIIGFTIFLAASALAKMVLYITTYGLTLMRVYVAWFLVLVILTLAVVIIKLFKKQLPIVKYIFIIFTVMFIGLNYSNVDYIIAEYNTNLYLKGQSQPSWELHELSSSSVGSIIKLYNEGNAEIKEEVRYLLEAKKKRAHKENWQQWNLAAYRAEKALNGVKF